jgi:hypothetical protein
LHVTRGRALPVALSNSSVTLLAWKLCCRCQVKNELFIIMEPQKLLPLSLLYAYLLAWRECPLPQWYPAKLAVLCSKQLASCYFRWVVPPMQVRGQAPIPPNETFTEASEGLKNPLIMLLIIYTFKRLPRKDSVVWKVENNDQSLDQGCRIQVLFGS